MPMLMNQTSQLQQLNLKQNEGLAYHPPKGLFKIVYQGVILPNLPAPLHYFNYISLIGQPRIPICYNASSIHTTALDTATVLASNSLHSVGHLKTYSIKQQCLFETDQYQFDDVDVIHGQIPTIHLKRDDDELSCDLNIQILDMASNFSALQWGVADYWSSLCQCSGVIQHKEKKYQIDGVGRFKYARAIYLPFLPLCFYTYQVINLSETMQLVVVQLRNQWNSILFSRLEIQNTMGETQSFTENVDFHVHRVYPKVRTPNGREMYLPREFSWQCKKNGKIIFELYGESRGDYKFGLAAGYVGSFRYQLSWNEQCFIGNSAYCEYIDCRPLRWQEKNKNEQALDELLFLQPCLYKK